MYQSGQRGELIERIIEVDIVYQFMLIRINTALGLGESIYM